MIEYLLNGNTIKVRPEHEQQFLENNPSATLAQGKNQSSAQDATAEQNPTASDSQSGTTSSDSQERNFNFLDSLKYGFLKAEKDYNTFEEMLYLGAYELIDEIKGGLNLAQAELGLDLHKFETDDRTGSDKKIKMLEHRAMKTAQGKGLFSSPIVLDAVVDKMEKDMPQFEKSITEDFKLM